MSKESSAKYQNNKEILQKNLVKNIKVYPKKKKRQYGCKWYKNLPGDEKQRLIENKNQNFRKMEKHKRFTMITTNKLFYCYFVQHKHVLVILKIYA